MAIKAMNTLIKLHKRRVDVLRREMVALEEERQQFLTVARNLQEEYAREAELSANDAKMAAFFGAYAKRVRQRQESIAKEVARLDAAIDAKTEAIREEFAEQKKYEIAKTNAAKRLASQENQRQQARFDEIGSQQYVTLKEGTV